VRIGRHAHEDPVALSGEAVYRLVHRECLAAGVPDRLAHPHALRAYWATHCLEAGVSVHEVSARLGHVDLRTTTRYAAPRPERVDDIADVLDRRYQAARRAGGGRVGPFQSLDLGERDRPPQRRLDQIGVISSSPKQAPA